MPKEIPDIINVHSIIHKVCGFTVAHSMWVYGALNNTRRSIVRCFCVFSDYVADALPSQPFTVSVAEQRRLRLKVELPDIL